MTQDCIEEGLNKFHIYDQAVDIVCCWEANLGHLYSDVFNNYYFDRFPSLTISDDEAGSLTPDFTVYFNDRYGIIGEIKRTFPDDDVAFNSTLDQISNYDRDVALKTGDDEERVPNTCDIVLIISGTSAPQIGTRISDRVGAGKLFQFDNNVVLIRYQFNTDATVSRYEFQRVTQLEFEFRDDTLPEDISLSNRIGQGGDYGTMYGYPKHFAPPIKSKKPLCNDEPPAAYLATILWHRVFPDYLSEREYWLWKQGNSSRKIPISDTVSGFTDNLNDYMKEGTARESWVTETLEFLRTARLASRESSEYEIEFRDLVQNVGTASIQEGTQMLQQSKELAYMMIERYCTYHTEQPGTDAGSQSSLSDYE